MPFELCPSTRYYLCMSACKPTLPSLSSVPNMPGGYSLVRQPSKTSAACDTTHQPDHNATTIYLEKAMSDWRTPAMADDPSLPGVNAGAYVQQSDLDVIAVRAD